MVTKGAYICVSLSVRQGYPFMERLVDNRPLLYSLLASTAFMVCLITGTLPEAAQQFEIVEFPPKV